MLHLLPGDTLIYCLHSPLSGFDLYVVVSTPAKLLIKDHCPDFERFLLYYGEAYARLDRTEGANELNNTHSVIFLILSPLLFYQPDVYFEDLKKVYPDQTVHYNTWRKFLTELKDEWEKSLIPVGVTQFLPTAWSSHRDSGYRIAVCKCWVPRYTKHRQ